MLTVRNKSSGGASSALLGVLAVVLTVLAIVVAVAAPFVMAATEDDEPFSLTPTVNGVQVRQSCNTDSGRNGTCIKYSQCRDNYTVDIWGTIDDNEIRVAKCPGSHWCCEYEAPYGEDGAVTQPPTTQPTAPTGPTATTAPPTVPTSEPITPAPPLAHCSTAAVGECPWCVTLHRDGGAPWTRGPDGRYCAGALVGDGGAVLTAASCVRAATRQTLWLQHAGLNYTVHSAAIHPKYDSANREHDLAVVVLTRRVVTQRGACLALDLAPLGECRAFAPRVDDSAKWTEAAVSVSAGLCGVSGGAAGAACAHAERPDTCRVLLGAPLLCPSATTAAGDGWSVAGVSRGGGCKSGAAYSSVMEDAHWLRSLLPTTSKD